jgi:putative addiction module CopG family antidote
MTIELTPDLAEMVQATVQSGRYGSVEAVLRDALVLLKEETERRTQDFQSQVDRFLGQIDDDAEILDEIIAEAAQPASALDLSFAR